MLDDFHNCSRVVASEGLVTVREGAVDKPHFIVNFVHDFTEAKSPLCRFQFSDRNVDSNDLRDLRIPHQSLDKLPFSAAKVQYSRRAGSNDFGGDGI